jgi:NADH-quinone oxidoreductase subunit M
MGLPGLNGFIGEFNILLGAWGAGEEGALGSVLYAAFAALGVILAAVYMLLMIQKLFLGPLDKEENKSLKDIDLREILILVPILVLIFWIGLYPDPFFKLMGPTVEHLVEFIQTTGVAVLP